MHTLLKLAWRNVWRNTRRSVLTIAAVAFGLGLCIYTRSFSEGYHNQIVRDTVGNFSGHIQISKKDWQDNQTLEYMIEDADKAVAAVPKDDRIVGYASRVVTPGLLSRKLVSESGQSTAEKEENTQFIMMVGALPSAEKKITCVPDKLISGSFLKDDDKTGILLGADLAKNLGVGIGDRVLFWTQDYYESLQAKFFIVRGIFRLNAFEIDGAYAIAHIESIQALLHLDGMITNVAVKISDNRKMDAVADDIRKNLGAGEIEAQTWEQFNQQLRQYIVFDDIMAYIFLMILIIVVSFGILNTQLMSVFERIKEFGTMLALGSTPARIAVEVFIECFFMTAIGVIAGNLLGCSASYVTSVKPINLSSQSDWLAFFNVDPLIYTGISWQNLVLNSSIVFVIALSMSLWPSIKASRFKPVEALRYI